MFYAEWLVVTSHAFGLHPVPLSAGVIFDLVVVAPLAWWLIMVRSGSARPRSVIPVALAGIAIASIEDGAAPGAEWLAVLGTPALTLRLREPASVSPLFGKARRPTALALQIDDPAALRAALWT